MTLAQERLKQLLDYSPDTGLFYWRVNGRNQHVRIGKRAGSYKSVLGYCKISFDRNQHLAHRLAWLYVHGKLPINQIDHINGNPADNRIANLREATPAQNLRNSKLPSHNSSGLKGVARSGPRGKPWRAYISINNKAAHLGTFDTKEEAHAAYMAAARSISGEFARAS